MEDDRYIGRKGLALLRLKPFVPNGECLPLNNNPLGTKIVTLGVLQIQPNTRFEIVPKMYISLMQLNQILYTTFLQAPTRDTFQLTMMVLPPKPNNYSLGLPAVTNDDQ